MVVFPFCSLLACITTHTQKNSKHKTKLNQNTPPTDFTETAGKREKYTLQDQVRNGDIKPRIQNIQITLYKKKAA